MSEWLRLFDKHTPHSALAAIVNRLVEQSILALCRELDEDPTLSDRERAQVLVAARPKIALHLRTLVEGAWLNLQTHH